MATGSALAEFRGTVTEMVRRGFAPPEHFRDFVRRHNPRLLGFEHIPRLVNVAHRVALGELTRVIVVLPPRYMKTEVFGRLLPAYFLRQNPHLHAGIISYGAELAWETSQNARTNFEADGGRLSKDTSAKKRWLTHRQGGLWAVGVGGPMLGRGFHLAVVDDPVDPEKAGSPTYQHRFTEWWPAKFLSRQEPGARIVLVMQRLGMSDPVDFLLRREIGEGTDRAPQNWHVVFADEVRSDEPLGRWDGPMGLPPTCTLEPDVRRIGDVLAPSRFSPEQVEEAQAAAGPYIAATQRQGRPMRPAGDYWREAWFGDYETLPPDAHDGGVDWDTAYTAKEANSATAWVETYRGRGADGKFPIYIESVNWDWMEFPDLVDRMRSTRGPHYVEAKATGKSVVQALQAEGIRAEEVTVDGDKFARANAVQRAVREGRVLVSRRAREDLLMGERMGLLRVTAENLTGLGRDLDVNDAFVQALHRHLEVAAGPVFRMITG